MRLGWMLMGRFQPGLDVLKEGCFLAVALDKVDMAAFAAVRNIEEKSRSPRQEGRHLIQDPPGLRFRLDRDELGAVKDVARPDPESLLGEMRIDPALPAGASAHRQRDLDCSRETPR